MLGIAPVIALPFTKRSRNPDGDAKFSGIVPVNSLFEKYNILMVGTLKMVDGREPANLLFEKSAKSREPND